jgi:hypothetical protein
MTSGADRAEIDIQFGFLCVLSVRYITAGFSMKHRDGYEKLSDIFGPKQASP